MLCLIRHKGPQVGDTVVLNDLVILTLEDTLIQISDTDSPLKSLSLPDFRLIHKPRQLVSLAVWVSLLGMLRLLTHQTITYSKALLYLLSLIQNYLLFLVSFIH